MNATDLIKGDVVSGTTFSRPVGIVRIVIGFVAAALVLEIGPQLERALDPTFFRVRNFEWLPDIPLPALPFFLGLWVTCGVLFAAGAWTRLAGTILGLQMAYVLALDRQLYSNHLYLLTLLVGLLTIARSMASFSVETRNKETEETIPAWPVTLLKVQATFVYGFASLSKLNSSFLSGAVLAIYLRPDGFLAVPRDLRTAEIMVPLAILTILTEAFIAVGLWLRPLRPAAFALGLAFHISIAFGMRPVLGLSLFSVGILVLYMLFLDSRPLRRQAVWNGGEFPGWLRLLRRLDYLSIHRWEHRPQSKKRSRPRGLAQLEVIGEEEGERKTGFHALRAILEVLPVSFLWAPLLALVPVRSPRRPAMGQPVGSEVR